MPMAKNGDRVKVHYTGTFDDGEKFDSSEGREPLEFVVGSGSVIKGFETAVIGLSVGEERNVSINPEDGYGLRSEELVQELPLEGMKDADKFQEGMMLTLRDPEGSMMNARVAKIENNKMTLDLNHPLAGKTLNFSIKLVEIC
ncbi:peptidylprolyl isomerase [Candidatus Parvarchaeota archaeon]|nr:peptidylprolyl isomerase [Candidatus Parvarchaeota archaeon]